MAVNHLRGYLVVCSLLFCLMPAFCNRALAEAPTTNTVEGQPLAANATRLLQALDFLGTPLPEETVKAVRDAARRRDAKRLQELLDPNVLFVVSLNPEVRVKVSAGRRSRRFSKEDSLHT